MQWYTRMSGFCLHVYRTQKLYTYSYVHTEHYSIQLWLFKPDRLSFFLRKFRFFWGVAVCRIQVGRQVQYLGSPVLFNIKRLVNVVKATVLWNLLPLFFAQNTLPGPHMNRLKRFCELFCVILRSIRLHSWNFGIVNDYANTVST